MVSQVVEVLELQVIGCSARAAIAVQTFVGHEFHKYVAESMCMVIHVSLCWCEWRELMGWGVVSSGRLVTQGDPQPCIWKRAPLAGCDHVWGRAELGTQWLLSARQQLKYPKPCAIHHRRSLPAFCDPGGLRIAPLTCAHRRWGGGFTPASKGLPDHATSQNAILVKIKIATSRM